MRVKRSWHWSGQNRDSSLEEYFTPTDWDRDGGAVEQAYALAQKNAKAIGCILARMVEKGLMTFQEAEAASGEYGGELLDE